MYKSFDSEAILKEMIKTIEDKELPLGGLLKHQVEYLGYVDYVNPKLSDFICILDLNTKYSPKIQAYHLDTGNIETIKVSSKTYSANPFDKGSILQILSSEKKNKSMKIDGKWCKLLDEFDIWLSAYKVKS